MRHEFSKALDFYLQIDKSNHFHQHIIGNNTSPQLISLRLQCFVLNKLSLLPLHKQPKLLQFYGKCLINVIENPITLFKNYDVVKNLVWHVENYYSQISTNKTEKQKNNIWPYIRSALMLIEDKTQKHNATKNKQFVILRRGLLENNKEYFLSQMMAKKVQTKQLKDLINYYKFKKVQAKDEEESMCEEQVRSDSIDISDSERIQNIRSRIRNLLFEDRDEIWIYISNLNQENDFMLLEEHRKEQTLFYIQDILLDYVQSSKIQGYKQKSHGRKLREKVIFTYISSQYYS